MTNFELYRLLNLVINKDVHANAISPQEFDLQLKAKNILLFTSKLPGERQTLSRQVEGSRQLQHDLAPFLIDGEFPVNGGVATVPFLYYCENFYSADSITSELISPSEVAGRLKSYIKPPSMQHLVATVDTGKLKIYGMTSGKVNVIGYRLPYNPAFKTVIDSNTLEMIYRPTESMELEWNEGCKLEVLHLILQDMGVTIERGEVSQLANKLITTGK